jgi:LmbE family N-acetylglucosaminyl deacetylase
MSASFRGFTSDDRLLVLAPHPDDETLATGGLLQRAAAAGASTRVVFVTDGENNAWPQRVLEYRWRIAAPDRLRWGARRRCEALGALAALGVPARNATFLGLPDLGLARLLLTEPERVVAPLSAEIAHWNPTIVVMPSWRDRHPDHSAVGLLARLALARLEGHRSGLLVACYLVHTSRALRPDDDAPLWLRLTQEEKDRKHLAVDRHATQLVFHRRSFTRAAHTDERFATIEAPAAVDRTHPVRYAALRGTRIELELAPSLALGALRRTVAVLMIWGSPRVAQGVPKNVRARLGLDAPSRGWGPMVSEIRVHGIRRSAEIALPVGGWRELDALFIKVVRRIGVFDSDGWREIPTLPQYARVPEAVVAAAPAEERVTAIAAARSSAGAA